METVELVEKLETCLTAQSAYAAKYEMYYDGEQKLPLALTSSRYRESFLQMIREVTDNWLPIVVDAVAERLNVEGFRLGEDPSGDKDAHAIWQRNQLDADSALAHVTALKTGRAAVMISADPDNSDLAQITVEHPSEVAVIYEPGSRRKRRAAIKSWTDDWEGEQFVNLYLPDQTLRLVRRDGELLEREDAVPNTLGVVPIVELRNRPALKGLYLCRSELHEFTSTQDQITKLVIDLLVASEFASFRQRYATGLEVSLDDDGNPVEPFQAAIDRLWVSGDPDTKFGEFNSTELKNYVTAIENRIQSLASRSRTPAHYMLGASGAFPSGESLKATETGLVAKVRERQIGFGEAWEEVMRIAFLVEGNEAKANALGAELIWRDPESRTESEHVDATMKKKALNVPDQQLWEDLGYTPAQIERFSSMLLDQAFRTRLSTPAINAPSTPVIASPAVPAGLGA